MFLYVTFESVTQATYIPSIHNAVLECSDQDVFEIQVPTENSIMLLHVFGAFFGLTLTWILFREGSLQPFEKEKFDRQTGLFSMLGKGSGHVFGQGIK